MNEKELKRLLLNYSCNIKMFNSQLMRSKSNYESIKNTGAILTGENQVEMSGFEENIGNILKNMREEQNEFARYLDAIEQPYKGIIYEKYVMLKNFDEIASAYNYSVQRIYQLHKKGLENLLEHLNTLE